MISCRRRQSWRHLRFGRMTKPTTLRVMDGKEAPSYDAVATFIAPQDTPPWLKSYLVNWAPSLMLDRGVAMVQPTKVEMKKRLLEASDAAFLLHSAVSDTATREFIERAGGIRFDTLGGLQHALQNIGERAKVAANSAALSTATGKTKSGRGKALPPDAYAPKTFCAVVIAEAWKFLRGEYPVPRNPHAAEAAQAYWLASGGTSDGWGEDPLGGWRPYFKRAMGPETAKERAECLRHLRLHRQQG